MHPRAGGPPLAPATHAVAGYWPVGDDSRGTSFAPGTRSFVNAAAEITRDDHSVQRQGIDQRKWLVDVAAEALGALGHPEPGRLARKLMMLRTGASMVLGLDSYKDTRELFFETWQAMIDAELPPGR